MIIKNSIISIDTVEELQIVDITERIKELIKKTAVKNGIINIQSLHTTASVFVNENEPLLLQDIKEHLEHCSPKNKAYNHNNFEIRTVNMCPDEKPNAHSHCRALHMPTSVCLNIVEGKLQIGLWQSILFIELAYPKKRNIQIQIIGE